MKICPNATCQAPNADDNKFCIACGAQLSGQAPAPGPRRPTGDSTILSPGPLPARSSPDASKTRVGSQTELSRGPLRQKFDVSALFGEKSRLLIGRAPDCDIKLRHPSVSRYHARLER